MVPGSQLLLQWCDSSNPNQAFTVNSATGTVTDPTGSVCVTESSPYPAGLTMQPCTAGADNQNWLFNASTQWPLAFTHTASNGCVLWNTQGPPGYEAAGSTVGVYGCSAPTPFDSVFSVNYPFPGALAAMYTEPGNSTFPNLCVEAIPPPSSHWHPPADCLPAQRDGLFLSFQYGYNGRHAGLRWRARPT